jgi:hypothetical protein
MGGSLRTSSRLWLNSVGSSLRPSLLMRPDNRSDPGWRYMRLSNSLRSFRLLKVLPGP